MDIIKAIASNNLCFKKGQKMIPQGIVVHSTGANNPELRRYVNAPEEVGKNQYDNHWDRAMPEGRKVCVHAFIGYDKNRKIKVAEILPLDICCWGVGRGSKGSYNYEPSYIQFEVCEDNRENKTYYEEVFDVAAEYCAYLCEKFNIATNKIVSHKEAYTQGFGSNHGDPDYWMKNFGENMDCFRKRVQKYITKDNEKETDIFCDGDLVSVKSDARYYNGKNVPEWVKRQRWYVKGTPIKDRVVIDLNEDFSNSICSPISSKFLIKVQSKEKITEIPQIAYLIRVTANELNIRENAGINYKIIGEITDKGIYTIIDEKQGKGASMWGKLKSGIGWISLDYTKRL